MRSTGDVCPTFLPQRVLLCLSTNTVCLPTFQIFCSYAIILRWTPSRPATFVDCQEIMPPHSITHTRDDGSCAMKIQGLDLNIPS